MGAKELYLLDEPQVLSLLVNVEKADYQVIQSVKFAHLHQSTFEPHFFLNIPSWLEGITGYPNCKRSPGITVRMQVLETRQESCFKDGKGGKKERPSFPCLRSWESLENEGKYVTWSEMWIAHADFDPGESCLAQVCSWWGSPRCRCQIALRLMEKLGSFT